MRMICISALLIGLLIWKCVASTVMVEERGSSSSTVEDDYYYDDNDSANSFLLDQELIREMLELQREEGEDLSESTGGQSAKDEPEFTTKEEHPHRRSAFFQSRTDSQKKSRVSPNLLFEGKKSRSGRSGGAAQPAAASAKTTHTSSARGQREERRNEKQKASKQSINSISNKRFQDLEMLLEEKKANRERQDDDNAQVADRKQINRLEKQKRFRVSRTHAAPVERILEYARGASGAGTSQIPNFYQLLAIPSPLSSSAAFLMSKIFPNEDTENVCDVAELKKRYRQLALLVHPDKNPHPDAKEAFDFLQEAYDTLLNQRLREQYNEELRKQFSIKLRWNTKSFKRWVNDVIFNWKSQFLLIRHQWTTSQPIEFVVEWKSSILDWFDQKQDLLVHFALLPSVTDRFRFVNDLFWKNKFSILAFLLLFNTIFWK